MDFYQEMLYFFYQCLKLGLGYQEDIKLLLEATPVRWKSHAVLLPLPTRSRQAAPGDGAFAASFLWRGSHVRAKEAWRK